MPAADDCLTLTQCPACSAERLQPLPIPTRTIGEQVFGPHLPHLGLTKCLQCSLVFTNPRPSPALLNRFYQGDDYEPHARRPDSSPQSRRLAEFLLERMRALGLPAGGRLLDYGCGSGFFVEAAGAAGLECFGFEVGRRALRECAAQGLRVVDDLSLLPQGTFDGIIMHHVLEHLDGFASLFTVLRALLKPGGALFIVVPNARSLRARLSLPVLSQRGIVGERHMSFPIHLSHFNGRSLAALVERHGFQNVRAETFAFGITDLFQTEPPQPGAEAAHTGGSAGSNPLKRLIKWAFYGVGWGENLLVASRRP